LSKQVIDKLSGKNPTQNKHSFHRRVVLRAVLRNTTVGEIK
jgi:hypothetical protein